MADDGSFESPSEEQIRVRAYEIFQRRAGTGGGGSPEQDWILAEEELRQERNGAARAEPQAAPPAVTRGRKAPAAPASNGVEAAPPKRSVRTVPRNSASRRSH